MVILNTMKKNLSEMKKDLDIDLGKLVALKLINQESLSDKLGISRPNLIAAFKGRRLLPHKYFAGLVEILNLDNTVKFKGNTFHALTVNSASKQYYSLYDVLYVFSRTPLKQVALLNSIGEKKNGYVYILKDSKNAYFVVRDDGKVLSYYDEEDNFPNASKSFKKLFKVEDYPPSKEISAENLEKIIQNQLSLPELLEFIDKKTQKVWTWDRLREATKEKGISVEEIAKALKLEN